MSTSRNEGKRLYGKVAGALYGFAIGDAMGATTEFTPSNLVTAKHGHVEDIIGGGWLHLQPGQVTDDTQMMLCVCDALMDCDDIKSMDSFAFGIDCMCNFQKWYDTHPVDIGGQCKHAIELWMGTKQMVPEDSGALGNGALMRALPCALLGASALNVIQGIMTHNNGVSSSCILAYTSMVRLAMFNDKIDGRFSKLMVPTGHVVNTMKNACYWARRQTLEEAIVGAANRGGDADTIAALAGGLAGAKFGFGAIPKRWVDQLNADTKKQLDKFAKFVMVQLSNQK